MSVKNRITVAGLGYVGMSLAVLLARHHRVVAYDIDPGRVDKINARQSTVADPDIDAVLAGEEVDLTATLDAKEAFAGAEFIIVAAPTNYDEDTHYFNTSAVEQVIRAARQVNETALIVIKSTIPVGFTASQRAALNDDRIAFSPEFLREGKALHDNFYPSRIIVGSKCDQAAQFAEILRTASLTPDVEVMLTGSNEAEAVKLFANSYLATRVSFFNELDSFGYAKGLNVSEIIRGVSLDPRIGPGYNNPSFGYGGYCLPKDTKQLLANYEDIPHQLIQAVVETNAGRKAFIADEILKLGAQTLGVYRLTMKQGSDNMRSSAMHDIVELLVAQGARVLVYEPMLKNGDLAGAEIVDDLDAFLDRIDLLICNRQDKKIKKFSGLVFTRDIFGVD
ncbi:nucleotide sugar dehydrogenase [Primorskyibacter aestuariivivens]|uniref:nucleotide sugar dehydrogenase n=1 Tax=Primorskyibacter aestuariivivens TaxID=1888912 RepID=UPI0023019F39|nr:nucleotide sugar dehydrogenase [Primorskyibacter aestuariivivens]MDA7430556.1 nucleotide sugar dehydrogenase [Primorskyibacter aestuariivivens]